MDSDLSNHITEFISECHLCTIATVDTNGKPNASTVFIKNIGMDIFFNTTKDSQKIRNILSNPRVAIAMQKAPLPKTDQEIKGIQYDGIAEVLSETGTAEVPEAVMARHRVFNSLKPGQSVIVKVTPLKIYIIDYSRGFRHRDLLQFR
ncbi:MAG: pyridoxamine 5'-phosphate oxidase family protein [Syntrophales bacterium]